MTTNLVLQGPQADQQTLERLARLAKPQRSTALGERCLRAEGVEYSAALRQQIDAAAFEAGVDATFIAAGRTLADFGLVAMDMDSTLITIECIDEIADMQGLKAEVSMITEAAMRGEMDFRESLTRRVALLEGLPEEALARVFDERLQFNPGAEALIAGLKQAGIVTVLVSGGFTYFTNRLQKQLGFDYAVANELEIRGGKLTGKVKGDIVDGEAKRHTLQLVRRHHGFAPETVIAAGDGANDLPMLHEAGVGIAYHAKPVVRAQATYALNHCGLDGILNLLG